MFLTAQFYVLAALLGYGLAMVLVVSFCAIAILLYFMFAKGLLTLSDRLLEERGIVIEPRWMAWIPVVQWYVAGKIAVSIEPERRGYPLEWIAFGVMLATSVINGGFLTSLLSLAALLVKGYLGYAIAGSLDPDKRPVHTIISVFFPQITYFRLRNNDFQD